MKGRNRIGKLVLSMIVTFAIIKQVNAQQFTEVLGRPTNSSITASVIFDGPANVYFEYGTTPGVYTNNTQTFTTDTSFVVEEDIIGLQPNTRYYYRTRYKSTGQATFLASPEHTFITQREKGNSFRFTIEADCHPYDKKGYHPLWNIALQNQLKDTADFMFDLGDTFGEDHLPFDITNEEVKQLQLDCRPFIGSVCHSMPFFFCQGNHEGESGFYLLQTPPNNIATYETKWRKLFYPNPYPNSFYTGNNTVEGNGIGTPENYYAWEWGDALFVVLDMYRYYTVSAKPDKWDWTIGKEQYLWFKQTLENSNAKYKFVLSHHILGEGRGGIELANLYEWGGYSVKNKWEWDTCRADWGTQPIHQLMVDNNVDVYFQGHDHIFVKQDLDGIVYQTCPMPSDSSYKIGITDNGDAFLSGVQLGGSGHIRVTVASDSATVDYISAVLSKDETPQLPNGKVVYSYAIKKAVGTSVPLVNNEMGWSISPNPAQDRFTIRLKNTITDKITVRIFSVEGRLAHQSEYVTAENASKEIVLDRSVLGAGMYVVSVVSQNHGTSYQKLVIR